MPFLKKTHKNTPCYQILSFYLKKHQSYIMPYFKIDHTLQGYTSFLEFGDTIYCKTPSTTFVSICNFDKPISATQCFVETNDIMIDAIPEYFNDSISPCDGNACLTCNSFISDQSFESNLTGRIYNTQTYEQLTCGSSNVAYAIHCGRCRLMYVGETGRNLRSKINGHRAGIIKDCQSLLYKHFRLPRHSVAGLKVQILVKI